MSRHPTLKWAQRSDRLYVTVELPDAKVVKLKLEPEGRFCFSAKSGTDNIPYELDITFFDKVNVEESKSAIGLRNNVSYLIKKSEKKWWNRLLKQEGKPPVFVKVDWDKWVDEDEEHEIGSDMDFGDMDFSKLNMGGPDGFDDEEEDKDEDGDEDMQADSGDKEASSSQKV